MINNKRVVALIPARGGSKSILNKNIAMLDGKPLIAWSIDVAKNTKEIDRIIVSTDSENIEQIAKEYGAEVHKRPDRLAQDDSLVIETVRYVINKLKEEGETAEYLVLLEPTSPLRTVEDISQCIELLHNNKFDSVATFKEAELNPHRAWKIEKSIPEIFIEGAIPWLPRQKLPKSFQLNGAVYAIDINKLEENTISLLDGKVGALLMPKERSVDIDDYIDFIVAETIIKNKYKE